MRPLVLTAAQGGKSYPLDKDFIVIGRQDVCDIHIDHKSVSKQHCVILRRGESLWLRDLGSTNGSHVNGRRVRRSALRVKDTLGVAAFTFRVTHAEGVKPVRSRDAGTKKLNPEELQRLMDRDPSAVPPPANLTGPVVQVNALPDEFTPVGEADE